MHGGVLFSFGLFVEKGLRIQLFPGSRDTLYADVLDKIGRLKYVLPENYKHLTAKE